MFTIFYSAEMQSGVMGARDNHPWSQLQDVCSYKKKLKRCVSPKCQHSFSHPAASSFASSGFKLLPFGHQMFGPGLDPGC